MPVSRPAKVQILALKKKHGVVIGWFLHFCLRLRFSLDRKRSYVLTTPTPTPSPLKTNLLTRTFAVMSETSVKECGAVNLWGPETKLFEQCSSTGIQLVYEQFYIVHWKGCLTTMVGHGPKSIMVPVIGQSHHRILSQAFSGRIFPRKIASSYLQFYPPCSRIFFQLKRFNKR